MKITNRDWLIAHLSDAEFAIILNRGATHSKHGCEYCIHGVRVWNEKLTMVDALPGKCGTTPCAEGIRQWLEAERNEQCGYAGLCEDYDENNAVCKYGLLDKCTSQNLGTDYPDK